MSLRPADHPEIQRWRMALRGDTPEGWSENAHVWPTPQEVRDTLRGGPFYVTPFDLGVVRKMPEFAPCLCGPWRRDRRAGTYLGEPVYVTSEILEGYALLPGRRIEILHWRPPPGKAYLRPPLDEDDVTEILRVMRPFRLAPTP